VEISRWVAVFDPWSLNLVSESPVLGTSAVLIVSTAGASLSMTHEDGDPGSGPVGGVDGVVQVAAPPALVLPASPKIAAATAQTISPRTVDVRKA
jgi:hypothetical protein